ncbi:MAG: methyltransferase domain-containing protein [Robiginitomaculum sp.]|nr:methyltransferase domain-containing protein [Robiginitomaculum sp.]
MNELKIPFFMDGALRIAQGEGYRAGMDACLLAAAIQASGGKKVLELGSGVGTALLCAAWHNKSADFTGVEKQAHLVELAMDNIARNKLNDRVSVKQGDIANLQEIIARDSMDHVFFNPPFQDDDSKGNIPAKGRNTAFIADSSGLSVWIAQGISVLKSRGYMTLIHRAEYVDEILGLLNKTCGDIHVLPILPRTGNNAHRVLVRGRKGSRATATLCAPLVLHENDKQHTSIADAILRGKQALVF